jgi:hypothetical protein
MPNIGSLPDDSLARNAIIFEPRTDIERIIFIATPHQGSTVAMGNVAALRNASHRFAELDHFCAGEPLDW